MKVIATAGPGGPEALVPFEIPEPHAAAGEVRIRVRAATVNPSDLSVRSGQSRGAHIVANRQPPYIPGMEAAGAVDEVGEGVTRFHVGDRVMAIVLPSRAAGGAYAEWIVLDESSVALAPPSSDAATAATLPMNGLTAIRALDLLDLPEGAVVLVTGAAGAVGGYVVQLARTRGLRVLALAGAPDTERLLSWGAAVVLPRDEFLAAVRLAAPEGVDGVVDTALLRDGVFPAVRDGGVVAVLREWDVTPPRDIVVHPVRVSDYASRGDLLDELSAAVERGELTPCRAELVPAAEAPSAHRRLEAGGLRGRLVLGF